MMITTDQSYAKIRCSICLSTIRCIWIYTQRECCAFNADLHKVAKSRIEEVIALTGLTPRKSQENRRLRCQGDSDSALGWTVRSRWIGHGSETQSGSRWWNSGAKGRSTGSIFALTRI